MAEWKPIKKGDELPAGAILAGRTSNDGDVFVGRNKDGEVGKLNLNKGGPVNNIWCHNGGKSEEGEILIVMDLSRVSWAKASKGGDLPTDAFKAGNTKSDGDIYACRSDEGAVGKMSVSGDKVNNFWYHGDWFSKSKGEILCIDLSEKSSPPEASGYKPPAPPVAPPPADDKPDDKPPVDVSLYNADADCDGVKAGERVQWLRDNKGMSEDEAKSTVMREFPDAFSDDWMPDVMCDGVRAQDRAKWLVLNEGLSMQAAREKVKKEFPNVFGDWWKPDAMCTDASGTSSAQTRCDWLMANKGLTLEGAKQQVRREFPHMFGADPEGAVIDGKFPHTMSVVQTDKGPKLRIAVTPRNPHEVSLVAVHYWINDGKSMNFDIKEPQAGTNTYVHITPPGGGYPECPPGATIKYWLCVKVNGLLQDEPDKAGGHADRRLFWTAPS
jgi:hypothetical protein